MIKYHATVIHVGPLLYEFTDAGILVFFGEDAPQELFDFAVIHDGKILHADLVPGDLVKLDSEVYKILAVGEVANTNFANLGHLVLKFNGADEVELPGDVCVENKPLNLLQIGSTIEVFSSEDTEIDED